MVLLQENDNCKSGTGVFDEGPAHGRGDINPEHRQIIIQRSGSTDTEQKFRLGSLNDGTMRGHSGEVVEILMFVAYRE